MATTLPQAKGGEAGQLPPLSTNPPPHKAPWNVRQVICAISSSSQLCPGKLPRSVGLRWEGPPGRAVVTATILLACTMGLSPRLCREDHRTPGLRDGRTSVDKSTLA